MSPTDIILLILSLSFATLSIRAHGWTLNGIGPAFLALAGGFWQLAMQWLRHRSWLRHRDTDFVPGTQHLAIAAVVGWFLAIAAALTWAMLALKGLHS